MSAYVRPDKVLSPRSRVGGVVEVIYEGVAGEMSVARIIWIDNESGPEERIAVRWNGDPDKDRPLGTPVSRGQPTWFIIADYAAEAVEAAARHKAEQSPNGIAAGYRKMAEDQEREQEALEWTEGLIGDASPEAR